MEEKLNTHSVDVVLHLVHGHRKKLEWTLSKGHRVTPDVEDAVSDAVEKFVRELGNKIPLGKCRSDYLRMLTTFAKNKLIDYSRKGIGNQTKEDKTISSQKDDPVDLRHRASNRNQITEIDELVSDQDVFEEATKKDTAHVAQTLVDSVLCASSEAANKVTRKYFELLATKQEDVKQAELAKECHVSRASISYTFRKVRDDVTKRHPELKETYLEFFAI